MAAVGRTETGNACRIPVEGRRIIGKRAEVPPYVRIGRNCVIGANVTADATVEDGYIPSGTTIRASEKHFPYTV